MLNKVSRWKIFWKCEVSSCSFLTSHHGELPTIHSFLTDLCRAQQLIRPLNTVGQKIKSLPGINPYLYFPLIHFLQWLSFDQCLITLWWLSGSNIPPPKVHLCSLCSVLDPKLVELRHFLKDKTCCLNDKSSIQSGFLYGTSVLLDTARYLEVLCIGGDLKKTLGQKHLRHENVSEVWWTKFITTSARDVTRVKVPEQTAHPDVSNQTQQVRNTHRQNDCPQLQVGKQNMLATWDTQDTWPVSVTKDSERWEHFVWLTYLCWMASKQPCNLEEFDRKHNFTHPPIFSHNYLKVRRALHVITTMLTSVLHVIC